MSTSLPIDDFAPDPMTAEPGWAPAPKSVTLTFDDGPHPQHTPRVLDALAEHGAKAIFFILGKRAARGHAPALLRRMTAEGHLIANHGFWHRDFRSLSRSEIHDELLLTQRIIANHAEPSNFVRPPYGGTNRRVDKALREEGFRPVMWDVDAQDYLKEPDNGQAWISRCFRQIESHHADHPCIVLLHDVQAVTAEYLPTFLKELTAQGYNVSDTRTQPQSPAAFTLRPESVRQSVTDKLWLLHRLLRESS